MGKKIIILLFFILPLVGCDLAMDKLNVNESKYIVTSKKKDTNDYHYTYYLVKVGGYKWYDYLYTDTVSFNVGDTLVVNIKRVERE